MTRALRFSAGALAQLEGALAHIAVDDVAAALGLADRIEKRLAGLKRFPFTGRPIPELPDGERREVIVAPFRIIYRVVEDQVRILAVVHGRRDLESALPEDDVG